jgi:hypothetical protein
MTSPDGEEGGKNMQIDIDPKLKPLYANLLRLNIGKYLISESFLHLLIENNLDKTWNECEDYVRNLSHVLVLLPGYTGYAREALGVFLEKLNSKRDVFIEILGRILVDFAEWSPEHVDFSRIRTSLLDLGYSEDAIEGIIPTYVEIEKSWIINQKIAISEPREVEVDEKLCFVLMPFNVKFNPIYKNVIKKTVMDFGLSCERADEIFGTGPIINDIAEHIQKARVLIADLTGRNPNVFYELGLAHAKDKDVILITQNLRDIPFDVRHYRCIVYEDSIAGGETLKKGLQSTLERVLEGKG